MRVFIDSSVIVAAVLEGHREAERCRRSLLAVHRGETHGLVAAHSLAEAYATLTVIPSRPRLRPAEVWRALRKNVVERFEVLSLEPAEYEEVLEDLAYRDIPGGTVYDAVILRCAEKANPDRILTLNVRHFLRLRSDLADRIAQP